MVAPEAGKWHSWTALLGCCCYSSCNALDTVSCYNTVHTDPGRNCVAGVVGFGMDGIEEVISPLNYIVLTADGRALKISDIFPNYVEQL